jgi:hypothetical protein
VKVAQKVGAKAGELRSWLRQLSELQRSLGVGVVVGGGVVEVEVEGEDLGGLVLVEELLDFVGDWEGDEDEDFVLVVEVEVRVEVEEDEMGVCETQRTWPRERSQFASRVGFQAYSWADVMPKLVSIK